MGRQLIWADCHDHNYKINLCVGDLHYSLVPDYNRSLQLLTEKMNKKNENEKLKKIVESKKQTKRFSLKRLPMFSFIIVIISNNLIAIIRIHDNFLAFQITVEKSLIILFISFF